MTSRRPPPPPPVQAPPLDPAALALIDALAKAQAKDDHQEELKQKEARNAKP